MICRFCTNRTTEAYKDTETQVTANQTAGLRPHRQWNGGSARLR